LPAFATASEVSDFEGRDLSCPDEFVDVVGTHNGYLEPLRVSDDPTTAYRRAVSTARELGWEVVHQDEDAMTINARETSTIFKLVDDVVIRLRPDGNGAVIDLAQRP
jgi:uncharacterized protein (DUF1499 family)